MTEASEGTELGIACRDIAEGAQAKVRVGNGLAERRMAVGVRCGRISLILRGRAAVLPFPVGAAAETGGSTVRSAPPPW